MICKISLEFIKVFVKKICIEVGYSQFVKEMG